MEYSVSRNNSKRAFQLIQDQIGPKDTKSRKDNIGKRLTVEKE